MGLGLGRLFPPEEFVVMFAEFYFLKDYIHPLSYHGRV